MQFQEAVDFLKCIYKDPLKIVEGRLQTPDLKDGQRENKIKEMKKKRRSRHRLELGPALLSSLNANVLVKLESLE